MRGATHALPFALGCSKGSRAHGIKASRAHGINECLGTQADLDGAPGVVSEASKSIVLSRYAKYGWFRTSDGWQPANSVRYAASGLAVALDRGLEFGFSLTLLDLTGFDPSTESSTQLHGIRLLVKNASATSALIDWNAVTIVGKGGKAYPITHRGIRYADAAAPMAPSTIPPTATLEDFIFPRESIQLTSGRYGGWSGRAFFETLRPGDSFMLFLPVKRAQDTVEYQFSFEVITPPSGAPQANVPIEIQKRTPGDCISSPGWAWNDVQEECLPIEPAPAWCRGQWTGVRCIRK
jgi:hypothetical protein